MADESENLPATQERLREVLLSGSMPEPMSGCWIWVRYRQPRGYGLLSFRGRTTLAHRAAFQSFRGPIPEGMELDHLCRVRCCVNPDHLEPVTRLTNVRRGIRPQQMRDNNPGRNHGPYLVCRTKGHPLTKSNIYESKGRRVCKECHKSRVKRYRQRRNAARDDR